LTKADELNAIEWKGLVYLRSEASRRFYFHEEGASGIGAFHTSARKVGWTDWEEVKPEDRLWVFELEKRDGKWKMERPAFSTWDESVYQKVKIDPESKTPFDPAKDYIARHTDAAKKASADGKWSAAAREASAVISMTTDPAMQSLLAEAQLQIIKNWRHAKPDELAQCVKAVVARKEQAAVPVFTAALKEKYSGKVKEKSGQPYTLFAWALGNLAAKDSLPVMMEALSNAVSADAPFGNNAPVKDYLNALASLDGPAWNKFAIYGTAGHTLFQKYRDHVEKLKNADGRIVYDWIQPEVRPQLDKVLRRLGPASMLGGSKSGLNLSRWAPVVRVRAADKVDIVLGIVASEDPGKAIGSFTLALQASDQEGQPYVVTAIKDAVLRGKPMLAQPSTAPADDGKPARSWIGVALWSAEPPDVTFVIPGSPAEKAGVKVGDQVLAVNAVPLRSSAELAEFIRDAAGENAVELRMKRDEREFNVSVEPTVPPERNHVAELALTILAKNGTYRGVAADRLGNKREFTVHFSDFNAETRKFSGETFWLTSKERRTIEGTLNATGGISFKQQRSSGNAQVVFGVVLHGPDELRGKWGNGEVDGDVWIALRQQAPPQQAPPRRVGGASRSRK
jgi:hypothetical protein